MPKTIDELRQYFWVVEAERLERLVRRDILARDRSLSGIKMFNFNESRLNALIAESRYVKDKLREHNVRDEDMREPSVVDIIWEMRDENPA